VNNTNLHLPCTVSKLWPIFGQIFASDRECFTLTPSLGVIPANMQINFTSPETRMIFPPDAVNRTIVSLFVWTKHRNVTDGQTAVAITSGSTPRPRWGLCPEIPVITTDNVWI